MVIVLVPLYRSWDLESQVLEAESPAYRESFLSRAQWKKVRLLEAWSPRGHWHSGSSLPLCLCVPHQLASFAVHCHYNVLCYHWPRVTMNQNDASNEPFLFLSQLCQVFYHSETTLTDTLSLHH